MSGQGWDSYLNPGEKVLWQGQPSSKLRLQFKHPMHHVVGLIFVVFSVFWMTQAAAAGGLFWMFGLIFLVIGLFNAGGVFFWRAYAAKVTWYSLTNQRALIATDFPLIGRQLRSWPINAQSPLSFKQGAAVSDLYFASQRVRTKNGSYMRPIGFEGLTEGAQLYQTMLKIQRGEDVHAL